MNRQSAQEESLRRLEGRDYSYHNIDDDDTTTAVGADTETTRSSAVPHKSDFPDDKPKRDREREFHFPPLHTRPDLQPHFNYAPPSPRKLPHTPNSGTTHDQAEDNLAAPPPPQQQQQSSASLRPPEIAHLRTTNLPGQPPQTLGGRPTSTFGPPSGFDFGFPETPTEFQKSLMRFAFPVPHQIMGGDGASGGWSVEYGRPDLGYMLREWATGGVDGRGILGRRTAVFVCGPPSMRVGVASAVARLQAEIWGDDMLEEIFLHTENYAL